MQNTEKLKVLESTLGHYKKSGAEYLFNCPKCSHHKPKFSVNVEKNCWKCWVCNYSGFKLYRLVRKYGTQQDRERWAEADEYMDVSSFEVSFSDLLNKPEEVQPKINLPKEFKTLATNNVTIDSLPARNYLKSRGVTKQDILKWKIGYCTSGDYENRVIFPSFNINGDVNYFVGRSYDKNSWRAYKNPKISKDIVFNHLFIDWTSDVVLVEGVFDAIVAGNAVPLLGSSLESDSKLFRTIVEHDSPVYIALDYDAEQKASKLIQTMLSYDIELFKIDTFGYNDVGSMSKDVFYRKKASAKKIDTNNFLELKLTGFLA